MTHHKRQMSIKLNPRQRTLVEHEAARLDVSIAEVIRRVLDKLADERDEREARLAAMAQRTEEPEHHSKAA